MQTERCGTEFWQERLRRATRCCGRDLQLNGEGSRVLLELAQASQQRWKWLRPALGFVLVIASAATLPVTPWAWLGIGVGLALALLEAGRPPLGTLIRVDLDSLQLTPLQPELAGTCVPISEVREIRGEYETQGWDGRSVYFASMANGADRPILILRGTDDARAEAAGRVLGVLLDCPAHYVGSLGKPLHLTSPPANES
jgi:hypothetical protein